MESCSYWQCQGLNKAVKAKGQRIEEYKHKAEGEFKNGENYPMVCANPQE